jgi:hypothetical protein
MCFNVVSKRFLLTPLKSYGLSAYSLDFFELSLNSCNFCLVAVSSLAILLSISLSVSPSFRKCSSINFFPDDISLNVKVIIKSVCVSLNWFVCIIDAKQGCELSSRQGNRIRGRELRLPEDSAYVDQRCINLYQCIKLVLASDSVLHADYVFLLCKCGRATSLSTLFPNTNHYTKHHWILIFGRGFRQQN